MNDGGKAETLWSLDDPIFFVKIVVSMKGMESIPDETVYYRCRMTYGFVWRWLWFYEYLQARIKVANPRRSVTLQVGRMNQKMKMGKDFIEHRRATLLKNKNRWLDDIMSKPYIDDLFGFTSEDVKRKIQDVKAEMDALERGEITFPVIHDYVNNVKKWL